VIPSSAPDAQRRISIRHGAIAEYAARSIKTRDLDGGVVQSDHEASARLQVHPYAVQRTRTVPGLGDLRERVERQENQLERAAEGQSPHVLLVHVGREVVLPELEPKNIKHFGRVIHTAQLNAVLQKGDREAASPAHELKHLAGCARRHLSEERNVNVPLHVDVVKVRDRAEINVLVHAPVNSLVYSAQLLIYCMLCLIQISPH